MAAIDALEQRVRTVEEELAGERHVSRYMVEQAARNSEVLHAARSEVGAVTGRVDMLGADMAAVKATLATHGRALDILQQDVRLLRSEVGELNRRLDTELGRLNTELGGINGKLDILIAAVTPRDTA
jgi:hypothetical protein